MDGPQDSRLFVVCGRATDADLLQGAFAPYGNVMNVKVVPEKGVAYVKFDRASSAALAIENLNGAVLNQGRGPKLKVLLAEAPTPRGAMMPMKMIMPEPELSSDPDNVPLRSRLFIVVPKQADGQQIQDDLASFPDLEYCKTDLIAAKGVVFVKFSLASAALRVLEEVAARGGQVAGYKVKCMLAEPKTKRGRQEGGAMMTPDTFASMQHHHHQQQNKLDYGFGMHGMDGMYGQPKGGLLQQRNHYMNDPYGMLQGFSPSHSMAHLAGMDGMGGQVGLGMPGGMHLGPIHTSHSTASSPSPHAVSCQRLFVVVHKAVPEEMVSRLFRRFPGMEYCDLKKDRATGKSKGYAYVNYSTPEAASAAAEQLNSMEFPHQSGHRIKVMFAEPLGARPSQHAASAASGGSPHSTANGAMQVNTPPTGMTADLASVTDSLASLSLPPTGSSAGMDLLDDRMAMPSASPISNIVARELMFVA